jgi:AAA family ATP:ADP antiporter
VIERLLYLRPGDFRRGLPLFSYYFLIIATSQVGQIARDALVLDRYSALQLPYLDIAVFLLIGLVVALYIRLARMANLRTVLVGSLCFYALSVGALWAAFHFFQASLTSVVLYVWVGVLGALAPAQVWTLANFLWNTREAKRLFAMLGCGGILGGIFAGFISARLSAVLGAESLLVLMTVLLLGAVWIVVRVWNRRETLPANEPMTPAAGPRNLRDSLRLIADSQHLRVIAALVFLSSVVATLAAWQTKALAQEYFISKDSLAVFFGHLDGVVGIIALLTQLFLTGRVLQRFGLGVALAILPFSLLMGSLAVIVSGALWAVCLAKGSDRAFRYSIDTAAQQLLYLPVSFRVKLQVKSFIDTVVWRFGGGFGGLILLIFATRLGLTPGQIGWLCVFFVLIWLAAAATAQRQYVATLGESIRQFELDESIGTVPVLDGAASNVLIARLGSADAKEVLEALDLYVIGQQDAVLKSVRGLLGHPLPTVREKAIRVLREAADLSAHQRMMELLHDEDLGVRTEALGYLSVHDHLDPIANIGELGKFADFSICSATIAFLARPGETQNIDAARVMLRLMAEQPGEDGAATRRAAAQLAGMLPDYFEDQLAQLLQDSDVEVAKEALRSLGRLRTPGLTRLAIGRLEDPALAEEALEALAAYENLVVPVLRAALDDPSLGIAVRRRIPEVLLRIGTRESSWALSDGIIQGDSVLRYRIIAALNKLQEMHKHPPIDRGLVETVMEAEIMGHYRSYQILGTLGEDAGGLLEKSLDHEVERIFRLMKLLFPEIDLVSAHRGIRSSDNAAHANALEFLENTLSPHLRALLLPLVDGEITTSERIRLGNNFLNTRLVNREAAVSAMVHSEDPWLKSCGAFVIRRAGMKSLAPELERLVKDRDPLLQREMAQALGS